MKFVSFSFNDIMNRQVDGISMGSAVGPSKANIFVEFLEQQLFCMVHKPHFFFHYTGEIFVSFPPRIEALNFFHCLNRLYPFPMKRKKIIMLLFPDVLVENDISSFTTSVERATLLQVYIFLCREINIVNWITTTRKSTRTHSHDIREH